MYAPIARIAKVLARRHIDPGRKPRWVEDASARQIDLVTEAHAALRQR